jgi:CHASE3 domain sensor protein
VTLPRRLAALVLGFVGLVVVSAVVITWTVWARSDRGVEARRYVATMQDVARLSTAFSDQETGQRGFLLTGDESFLLPYQQGLSSVRELDSAIKARLPHDETVRRDLDGVLAAGARWRTEAAEPQITARRERGTAAIQDPAAVQANALFDQVRSALDRLQGTVNGRYAEQVAAGTRLFHVQVGGLVLALALALALAGGAVVLLRRWVTYPLAELADAVSRVGRGELGTAIPQNGPGDVRALARAIDGMRHRLVTEIDEAQHARQAVEQRASIVLELQAVLTPEPTDVPDGWTVAAGLRPAEGLLAGDCYDIVRLDPDNLVVMVLDIAGHGAVAALTALRCREVLRVALRSNPDPGQAFAMLDPLTEDLAEDLFLTAFLAVIDHRSGQVAWANAGHPPGFLRHGRELVELAPTGPVVGPFPGRWTTAEAAILPGGELVLYTDGLPEARGASGFLGSDRVLATVLSGSAKASELVDDLLTQAANHAEGRLTDDATALVVHRDEIAPTLS